MEVDIIQASITKGPTPLKGHSKVSNSLTSTCPKLINKYKQPFHGDTLDALVEPSIQSQTPCTNYKFDTNIDN